MGTAWTALADSSRMHYSLQEIRVGASCGNRLDGFSRQLA